MAKFCGGIKLDPESFKIMKGIISIIGEVDVDVNNTVSTCGQRWDGSHYAVRNGVITQYFAPELADLEKPPIPIKGNCGVGLDGRFFKVANGVVSHWWGSLLIVNASPSDATMKVTDVNGIEAATVSGRTNIFMLEGNEGDEYTLTVSKTGYITKTLTIVNNGEQTVDVELEVAGG